MSAITETTMECGDLISMDELARVAPVLRAISHPVRMRILDYLRRTGPERTVTEIERACGVSQAVVSQQLRILRDQRVLSCRREGNHVFYFITAPHVLGVLDCIRCRRSGDAQES